MVWGSDACMMIVVMIVVMIVGSLSSFQIIGMRPACQLKLLQRCREVCSQNPNHKQRFGETKVPGKMMHNKRTLDKARTPNAKSTPKWRSLYPLCASSSQAIHSSQNLQIEGILTLSQLAPLPSTFDLQGWPQVNKSIGLFLRGRILHLQFRKVGCLKCLMPLCVGQAKKGWQNAVDSDTLCREPYKLFGSWH